MGNNPDQGIVAQIPIGDLSLSDALEVVDDGSFFYETMPPIVYAFQHILDFDSYWNLRVSDHNLIVGWLTKTGQYGVA